MTIEWQPEQVQVSTCGHVQKDICVPAACTAIVCMEGHGSSQQPRKGKCKCNLLDCPSLGRFLPQSDHCLTRPTADYRLVDQAPQAVSLCVKIHHDVLATTYTVAANNAATVPSRNGRPGTADASVDT